MTKKIPVDPVLAHNSQEITNLITDFCNKYLNPEYLELCLKLLQKLARKKPSPLIRGKTNIWACGIVRSIGFINFLDDKTNTPHMKLSEIDRLLGVVGSSGQSKSLEIRKLLKIKQFDHQWMLPSLLEDSPIVWMIEVNGFIMDVRTLPPEIQEAAYEKGLIPYVPGSPSK